MLTITSRPSLLHTLVSRWKDCKINQSRLLARGCDEALFSEKRSFQWKGGRQFSESGLVSISSGKAIQWRGSGHSLNRRTLKTEKLLSSSSSRKSAPNRAGSTSSLRSLARRSCRPAESWGKGCSDVNLGSLVSDPGRWSKKGRHEEEQKEVSQEQEQQQCAGLEGQQSQEQQQQQQQQQEDEAEGRQPEQQAEEEQRDEERHEQQQQQQPSSPQPVQQLLPGAVPDEGHSETASGCLADISPGHLRPVTIKPVSRIFEISDSNPKMRKMRKAPLTLQKQGSEETPQSKNAENADTKTRKMRKMRLTGFDVTGFRWPSISDFGAGKRPWVEASEQLTGGGSYFFRLLTLSRLFSSGTS